MSRPKSARTLLRHRQRAYLETFKGEMAKAVLEDLAAFCRAHESTFHPDARCHAVLEGRREVYLRIQDQLTLKSDQLLAKYAGLQPKEEGDTA